MANQTSTAKRLLKGIIVDGRGSEPFAGYIAVTEGRIAGVYAEEEVRQAGGSVSGFADAGVEDFGDAYLSPGFIDIHIHGGNGADIMDGSTQGLHDMLSYYLARGTTSILATTLTASKAEIDRALAAVYTVQQQERVGQVIQGVHLEGPFLSPKWPGAQHPSYIINPQLDWLREWSAAYPGLVRVLTLAPELEGAEEAVAYALEQGIVAACGHSDASYEQMREAIGWGITHAVHCCNAMRPFHHREPGVVGAVLLHDEITTEINVDGYHLHAAAIDLIVKIKRDGVCLITDAMSAAGMPDGEYRLGTLKVLVKDGAARFENGTIAGSTIAIAQSVRNLVQGHSHSVAEAVKHATSIPARIVKLDRKGVLAAGFDADILVLKSGNLDVEQVMLGGEWFNSRTLSFV